MTTQARIRKRGSLRALSGGLRAALQWRLLLLWMLGLLLPTAIVALPVWRSLAAQFDHSPRAAEIASRFDVMAMTEAVGNMGDSGAWFGGVGIGAGLIALLLAPWLSGLVVASIRAGHRLNFAGLISGGVREYGRMLRTMIWALLPLGIAIGIGAGAMGFAVKQAENAILAADAERAGNLSLLIAAALFVIAHASVEAGRGVLAADPSRRSAIRAWGRGSMLLLRRPLATLLVYLATALLGYGIAFGLGVLRINTSAADWPGLIAGVLLTQSIVVALAWGHTARLYALADLAHHEQLRCPAKPRGQRRWRWWPARRRAVAAPEQMHDGSAVA